jgi:predicted S18 family serine protease
MLNTKKIGKVHLLSKYYKPVDRDVHVLKEAVLLAELQAQSKIMRETGLAHYFDLEEEREVNDRVAEIKMMKDLEEASNAMMENSKNKKRIRDAIINITETAPLTDTERIHLWIDEVFPARHQNLGCQYTL